MAFPTGYTKYQEITIDHTKVGADQTDFIVFVNLADMVLAGADIFDTCRSDGGDIRATKSDGTTQLATELVAIDTTAKTGELHIKFAGTLSSSVDTVIRIYYNGTDTALAVSDTYGRNAVWSDYVAVYHYNGDPSGTAPQLTDSTGNGRDGTSVGSMTSGDLIDGLFGKAWDFDGSNDYAHANGSVADFWLADMSVTVVAKNPTTSTTFFPWFIGPLASAYSKWAITDTLIYRRNSSTVGPHITLSPTNQVDTDWHHLAYTGKSGGHYAYNDGVDAGNDTDSRTMLGMATPDNIGLGGLFCYNGGRQYSTVQNEELRYRSGQLSATWISTEANNLTSASTFYSVGAEAGGSTSVTVTPSPLTAVFSIPTPTISAERYVEVSASPLTATFSIPAPVVSTAVTVSPNVLAGTFSIPTPIVDGEAPNVEVLPAPLTATFTIPSATITTERNAVVEPAPLSATFSIPAPTVTLGVAVTVSPDPLSAVFSIPAYMVTVISNITIEPSPLVGTFSMPSSFVRGDFWQDKFAVASDPFTDKVYNAGDNWTDKF